MEAGVGLELKLSSYRLKLFFAPHPLFFKKICPAKQFMRNQAPTSPRMLLMRLFGLWTGLDSKTRRARLCHGLQ